ncbi:MAG: tetrahydrofolate dehydrogenase/cyclohydrolase catalytic domain-containing protein, partial [Pirellulales bacterium]
MAATILDGKAMAQQIRAEIAEEVADFIQNNATFPCLAAVLVGDNPASEVYVRNKRNACERAGIESQLYRLPGETTTDELLALVHKLNKDPKVHGILVQLPLPSAINENRILNAISPLKDVDALHP